MKCFVDFLEIFSVDVRVNLRSRNIGVTEHFLHRPEIRSPFEEVRRERMPERMGVNLFLQTRR
jgi:hypothetical protein